MLGIRRGVVAGTLALATTPWLACDTPPPTYDVQTTILRLIPDLPTVPAAGGDVVVVLELSRAADTGVIPFATIVQSFDSTLTPLPGSSLCGAPDAGGSSADVENPVVDIPASSFRSLDNDPLTQTSVLTVRIPAGDSDALIVAAAYQNPVPATGCVTSYGDLLAFGSLRIARASAGASEAGEPPESDAGDDDSEAAEAGDEQDGAIDQDAGVDADGSTGDAASGDAGDASDAGDKGQGDANGD